MAKANFVEKIRHRNAKLAIIGLGRVGLPTAALFADAGFPVVCVDVKPKVIEVIRKGISHINEAGLAQLVNRVVNKGLLTATSESTSATAVSDVIIICVPTPITDDKRPNLSHLEEACKNVVETLVVGKLIVVESTIPPGTTRDFVAPLLETSGLKAGKNFWLAYCPERIAPGRTLKELVNNPRIVGGYDTESAQLAAELLKTVCKGPIHVTDCTTAEVAKLAENAFRDVNIAFANELALLCERVCTDITQVIKLANTHPRVSIHTPGPGVGGPCLPKDPFLLLFPIRHGCFKSSIIMKAREINDRMPSILINKVVEGLAETGKTVRGCRIAILGTAYKANIDDARFSPAQKIIVGLRRRGATVIAYDPHCSETFGAERVESLREALVNADALIVATDHDYFKNNFRENLRWVKDLMNAKPVIVDGRQFIDSSEAIKEGFRYYGIGCPQPERKTHG